VDIPVMQGSGREATAGPVQATSSVIQTTATMGYAVTGDSAATTTTAQDTATIQTMSTDLSPAGLDTGTDMLS